MLRKKCQGKCKRKAGGTACALSYLVKGLLVITVLALAAAPQLARGEQFLYAWGTWGVDDGQFRYPKGVAVDASGNVYVADYFNNRIQKFDSHGVFLTKWGTNGSGDGEFQQPTDVAVDASGNVYVADFNNYRIQVFTSDGTFVRKWTPDIYPIGIAVDASGKVYVVDYNPDYNENPYGGYVQVFQSDGTPVGRWYASSRPYGIAVDASGNVYVTDWVSNKIKKFKSDGTFIREWGEYGFDDGQFRSPKGVAVDASGYVYVTDQGNHRIQKFDADGKFIGMWGTFYGQDYGGFERIEGIAVDASGQVYVADQSIYLGDSGGHDRILVFDPNTAPIAKAGENQRAVLGSTVTLDGSGSSDPEQNYPLGYAWEIVSKPAGSQASLTGADTAAPSFVLDVPGSYFIRLIVTDSLGLASNHDDITVSTLNTAPMAYAGKDQVLDTVGTTVSLDGTGSIDNDGDSLTYSWTLTKPADSSAELSAPNSSNPTFVADIIGTYQITLVVTDTWGAASAPDTMLVSFKNLPPVADGGGNQSAVVGDQVSLDASLSSDPNGDSLTYRWSLVSAPEGSQAALSDSTGLSPSFIADVAGTFVVSLVVNDGQVDSEPCNVTVVVVTKQTAVTRELQGVIGVINDDLPDDAFKNDTLKNPLTNKINEVIGMVDQGLYQEALDKLQNDILAKTDGCAVSGAPDKNDWIKDCAGQEPVYQWVTNAIEVLKTMI